MNDNNDRLAEIKQRYTGEYDGEIAVQAVDDIDWLIVEVERLREYVEELGGPMWEERPNPLKPA